MPLHELQQLVAKIKTAVEKDNMYLDPNLSLTKLAQAVGSNTNKVSHVINEQFHQNFTDYINSHRIERAKELLTEAKHRERTILYIAFEVGFNSKATFNRAFARFSDISPNQFRKDNISPQV